MDQQTPQGHAAVFRMLEGMWVAHIVSAIAKLDIPDRLAAGAKTAADLAREIGADDGCLSRLLRTAAGFGLLTEDRDGRFGLTELTDVLRSDAAPGMKKIAEFFSDEWHIRSWQRLVETVKTGRPGLDLAYGMPFFEYLTKHPEPAATFFEGMTNFSSVEGPAVAAAYDFGPFQTVCDVGGGHGLLLALILERNRTARGVLLDQAHVVEQARTQAALRGVVDRVRFESGDMFQEVPRGMDTYVLKRILHDWSDAECGRILSHCRRGVNAGGKLLVVEQVILEDGDSRAARLMDLEMMVLLGGRERTGEDFRRILAEAGWRLSRIVPTASPMYILEAEAAS